MADNKKPTSSQPFTGNEKALEYLNNTIQSSNALSVGRDPYTMHPTSTSQYDAGFVIPQYDRYAALNELRAARQTSLDKLGNGLLGMTTSATTGALESTIGLAYGLASAAINQDTQKIWKNDFTDAIIDPLSEFTRENFPFYYSQAEQDAAWYQGVIPGTAGSANFWFDKVFNGAGFTLGSLAAGAGLSKLFGLTKAAASGRLLSDAVSAEQVLQKGAGAAELFKESIPMAKQFGIGMVMAHGEAALESRETYKQFLDNAQRLRAEGDPMFAGKSDEELAQMSKDAANTNYITNLAIVGPTDMILLGKFINPGTKASIRQYNKITRTVDDAGKVLLKDATLDNSRRALVNGGEAFLRSAKVEVFQEGGQFASNIASQEFIKNYQLKNMGWFDSLVSGMAEGIDESLSSKEGLQSMLIGGIVGGPFGLKGAKSERIAREANTKKRIEVQMSDPDFLTGGSKMANYLVANNALNASEEAKRNKDLFEANNQEAFALGKYVQAYLDTDQVDILTAKLESMKQAPDAEAAKFFGFEEAQFGNKEESINKILDRINRYSKMHQNIQRMYGISQGTPEQVVENQWLRNQLFEASFTLDNIEEREKSMGQSLTKLTGSADIESARKRMVAAHRALTSANMDERYEEYDKAAEEYNKKLEKILGMKMPSETRVDYQDYRELLLEDYREDYNKAVKEIAEKYPLQADEIYETLADLNKLAEKREQVISYINDLRNPAKRGPMRNFQRTILKDALQTEKEKRDEANKSIANTPVTTEEEVSQIIKNTDVEERSVTTTTPGGENLDIAKLKDEDLAAMYEEVQKELKALDPTSPEHKTKLEFAAQLNQELEFRANKQNILKDLQNKYRQAATAADKVRIIEEARKLGFPIDAGKLQQDLDKLEQQIQQAQTQNNVQALEGMFREMFKGPREFQEIVTRGFDNALFEQMLETENFQDYLTLAVDRFADQRTIPFGSAEKGTEHPRLGKQASEFNIVVEFNGKPLGFIVFYDTFIDKQTGIPIPVPTMTQQEYEFYFGKNPEYPLEEFKRTYAAAKAFHDYVTSDKFLKGGNFGTVTNAELLEIITPHLTSGRFKYVQVGEDFVPLSEFSIYRNLAGKPLIVDTSTKEQTTLSQNENITTYSTSQLDAYKVEIPKDAPVGTVGQKVVNPNLVDAFKDLHRIKSETRAYSRYWALVEQAGGPIKINGVSYRWTALTPSSPITNGQTILDNLNRLIAPGGDPGTAEARKEASKIINEGLFIAFGDNGTYASNFRVRLLPNYPSVSKDGKQRKGGYSLSIYSPTYFKNKPQEGTIGGVTWSLNEDKTTMFLNIEGMVGTFDQLIEEFEKRRNILSRAGGPLVGTTALVPNAFKINPSTSTQPLNSVPDLETKLSSTTEPRSTDQKLVFKFNELFLIPDYKPTVAPAPAVQPTAPVIAPAGTKEVIGDDVYNEFVNTGNVPATLIKSIANKIRQGVQLSPREIAMYQAKGKEIEAELKTLAATPSVTTARPAPAPSTSAAPGMSSSADVASAIANLNALLGKPAQSPAPVNPLQNAVGPATDITAQVDAIMSTPVPSTVSFTPQPSTTQVKPLVFQDKQYTYTELADLNSQGLISNEEFNKIIDDYNKQVAVAITPTQPSAAPVSAKNAEKIFSLKMVIGSYEEDVIPGYEAERKNLISQKNLASNPDLVLNLETKIKEYDDAITSAKESLEAAKKKLAALNQSTTQSVFNNTQTAAPTPDAKVFSRVESSALTEEEKINIATAFANLRKILPEWITAEELDALEANIVNGVTTLGYFNNNIIKLFSLATVGTEYHEAFHAVFRTMLTNAEQNTYYAIAKNELRAQLAKEGKSYTQHKKEYLNLTPEAAKLLPEVVDMLILEEYMAEKFKAHMNNQAKKSTLQKLFDKIKKFFRLVQTSELDNLFARIEKGKFKNASRVSNRFNTAAYSHAPAYNAIFLTTENGNHRYLNEQTKIREVNKIASKVLSALGIQESSEDNKVNSYNTDSVEDLIYKVIANESTQFQPTGDVAIALSTSNNLDAIKRYQDLIHLYNNRASVKQFAEEVMKALNKYNVNDDTLTVDDSEISDDSSERNYDKNQEQIGGFASLSKELKLMIALTTYEISLNDYLGTNIEEFEGKTVTVAVDPKRVYDGLAKVTANQLDRNNVLNIMADQLDNPSEMSAFVNKFFNETGIERNPFTGKADLTKVDIAKQSKVQMVATAFNLWKVDYRFFSLDPKGVSKDPKQANGALVEGINANVRDVDTKQVEQWANGFDSSMQDFGTKQMAVQVAASLFNLTNYRNEVSGKIDALTENELALEAARIQGQLRIIGMQLSTGYIKHMLLSNPDLVTKTPKQLNKIELYDVELSFQQFMEHLTGISAEIGNKHNPFRREEKPKEKIKGAVERAKDIARDNAIFDETVEPSSFTNAENKQIYGLQTDTFNIRKIFEIAVSEDWSYEEIQKRAEEDPLYEFLLDNYLLTSEDFNAIRSTLKVLRMDGMRERAIDYKSDTKENKLNIQARVTEGVTYGRMSDREFALAQYTLYSAAKKDLVRRGDKVIDKRPVMITVMEASNTSDAVSLPVIDAVDLNTGKIKDAYLENMYRELVREHRRIKSYQEGKFDANDILNFNYGANPSKHRAGKFWADTQVILESIYGAETPAKMEAMIEAESLEDFKAELKSGLESWLEQEITDHMDELVELGILNKDANGNYINILLPVGYSNTFKDDQNPNQLFPTDNLRTNIKQTYLSNMLNNIAVNQLLEGDPALTLKDFIDKFKRDKGKNASGMNTSVVNFGGVRKTSFNFSTYITNEFDDLKDSSYALSPTKLVPVYKPGKEKIPANYTEEFKELEKELTADQLKKAISDGQIAVEDAQAHGSSELFREIYSSLGRMSKRGHEIYDKIREGEDLTASDQKYLHDNKIMLNSLKMVYYDGKVFLKMSVAPLQKSQTSIKVNGKWVAQKGLERLHNMRERMEDGPVKIDLIGPLSMSKKMTKNPVMLNNDSTLPEIADRQIQSLNRNFFRLQQENPSNKLQIKDPTQLIQILAAEQDPTLEVILPSGKKMKIGEIREAYFAALGMRVTEYGEFTRSFISELKGGKITPKLKRLVGVFKETLQQSGASEKLLSILETTPDGTPLYDINLPDVVTKFEEMFNAHFNKIFSQKIDGYKTTLQSGAGHNIIYNKKTGKIITRGKYKEDMKTNPTKYDSDEYGTRELAFNQPRYDSAGNVVGHYSEIILPFHFAEQFGLAPGDEIPEEIAYMLGVRIPTQDKHSAMALKIVDILPPEMGSNAVFPKELIILTGSDFDIDSFYIHRPSHYIKETEDGGVKFMLFGNKEDSEFTQHMLWHEDNNVFVQSIVRADKQLQTPLAAEYNLAKQRLRDKKAELKQRFKDKIGELKDVVDSLDNPDDMTVLPIITARQKYKEKVKELGQIRKELKPFIEDIKKLEKQFVISAMQELNLPVTEEQFKKAKPKNIGALNNELLEYKIALLTNDYVRNEMGLTPATLRQIKDDALPDIMTALGFAPDGSDYGKKKVTFSMSGLLKAFSSNKAGSIAIGAAVNATQQFSVFSNYGLKLIKGALKIDGVTTTGISKTDFKSRETTSKKGAVVRIMDTLSTLTSSMTDNSKYLFNRLLNLYLETLGVVSYGVQQGVPMKHMLYIINNEYVVRYLKQIKQYNIQTLAEQDRSENMVKENLLQELIDKIKKFDPEFDSATTIPNLNQQELTHEELTKYLPYSSLGKAYSVSKDKVNYYDNLENAAVNGAIPGFSISDYYKAQYKMLRAYILMKEQQVFLNKFTSIIKMTKGIVGAENERSFSADDELMNNLEDLNIRIQELNGKIIFTHVDPRKVDPKKAEEAGVGLVPYDLLPIIQQDPLIRANLEEFYKKQKIAKEIFVSKTEFVTKAKTIVNNNIRRVKGVVRRKALRSFRRNFESYLSSMAFRKWWESNVKTPMPDFGGLLFKGLNKGEATLKDKIIKFQQTYPEMQNNLFFKLITAKESDVTGFISININTRNQKEFAGRVLDAFDTLYNHSSDGAVLAKELFFYEMAKNSLQFKNNSYISYIPNYMFRVNSNNTKLYMDILNGMDESRFVSMFGATRQEMLIDFTERFFTDANNSRIVPSLSQNARTSAYSFISEGLLYFPGLGTSGQANMLNVQTGQPYTADEARVHRNRRHDDLGSITTPDGNRSTAFPLFLKFGKGKTKALYKLKSVNGIAIENINFLGTPELGMFNGASAIYEPTVYSGSNIDNFVTYAMTKEEKDRVTEHLQAKLAANKAAAATGGNAQAAAGLINEDTNAVMDVPMDTGSTFDIQQLMAQQAAESAVNLPGVTGLENILQPFQDPDAPVNVPKPPVSVTANPSPENKAVLNDATLRKTLIDYYIAKSADPATSEVQRAIYNIKIAQIKEMPFDQLVNESNNIQKC